MDRSIRDRRTRLLQSNLINHERATWYLQPDNGTRYAEIFSRLFYLLVSAKEITSSYGLTITKLQMLNIV